MPLSPAPCLSWRSSLSLSFFLLCLFFTSLLKPKYVGCLLYSLGIHVCLGSNLLFLLLWLHVSFEILLALFLLLRLFGIFYSSIWILAFFSSSVVNAVVILVYLEITLDNTDIQYLKYLLYFYFVCVCLHACVLTRAPRRECLIPLRWRYWWLWATWHGSWQPNSSKFS